VYVAKIAASQTISALPAQVGLHVQNSLQAALISAAELPAATAAQVVLEAKEAFLSGLCESVLIASVILFAAAAINLVVLPKRTIRHDTV